MKRFFLTAALLAAAGTALAGPDAGLDAIDDLGRLNGQALACDQMGTSGKAKGLMISHAPKTRRYGEVFEAATNAAFLAQGKDQNGCPPPADFARRLLELTSRLQAALPVAQ